MNKTIQLMYDSIVFETEDACLIEFEDHIEEWIPTSMCEFTTIDNVECVIMPIWLAEDRGIEMYEYE
ncbi:MAG: hypothetical protein DRO67_00595 [Candidatus Asgardarchaeum californiense]|nr:MAG: hypothetical protein DRO67_00595 [Candidatus Asgardarchaeum californiense]